MKSIFTSVGDFIGRGQFTTLNVGVTNDGEYFTFPTNTVLNHLISVRSNKETGYDDVSFRFKLKARNVTASSRIGVLLKSATDEYDGERASFVLGDDKISFYLNNTKQIEFANFNIQTLNNKSFILDFRRRDDYYILTFQGNTYTRHVPGDAGSFRFRQNCYAAVYGSDVDVKIENLIYNVDVINPKFCLLGDSIANGMSSAGGDSEDTIKGIMVLEKGESFTEAAGSANVIKDSLDSFNDLAVIKPKYAIIMYGHNDTLFATGRLESDYKALVQKLKNYGIIPIICTMPYSAWIDITVPNDFIRDNYFNDDYLHIELFDTLTYPTDYADIAHPNVQGNRKLAEAIYAFIEDLP